MGRVGSIRSGVLGVGLAYAWTFAGCHPGAGASHDAVFSPPTVYSLDGVEVPGLMLPERVDDYLIATNYAHQPVVSLPGGRVFSAASRSILDQATGQAIFTAQHAALGAAAGRFAVVVAGSAQVSAEPF